MNIFYFVKQWPKSKHCARFDKSLSLLETLLNQGHSLSVLSSDTTPADDSQDLKSMPLDKVFINPKKISQSLASAGRKPQIAIFNDIQSQQMYSIFLYSKWNKCPRVLEVNQLHGLDKWRAKNYLTIGSPFLQQYGARFYPDPTEPITQKFTPQELLSIRRSDFYFCGNDFISFYLKKQLGVKNYILHSMGIPTTDYQGEIYDLQYREHRHRKHFAFLGNLETQKNIMMLDTLIKKIWPQIRKQLKEVQLHIYGSGYNQQLLSQKKQLKKIGIHLKGLLQDTQQIQKYRALLYPASHSTGTKGAIAQSWFQHTPVITTPIGAEGMFVQSSEPMYSAQDNGQVYRGFFKERQLTQKEETGKVRMQKYYKDGVFSDKVKNFNFGGICNNFSIAEFIESAINIYNDEALWKECLLKSRTCFLKHHGELQMEVNLSYALSQASVSLEETRRKKQYVQAWDGYLKSKEGHKRLHQKNN